MQQAKKRKILFVTERRADYSRLKPIMRLVQKSRKLKLQLVITGLHLSREFGDTRRVIENDGFRVDASIPVYKKSDADDGKTMAHAFGSFVHVLTDAISRLKPDVVFCGFDLGAHLAAAIVGMHLNIPVAHIQGGERSGTIDEVLRHATTKFSHIHFVGTRESRARVIKLGEDPKYVFLVGSPSVDTIRSISYGTRTQIFRKYGMDPRRPLIVLAQHPVTTEVNAVLRQIRGSIGALTSMKRKYGAEVIAIYSNNDSGGKRIVAELKKSGFKVFPHIVFEDYLRLLKVSDALVGNSSAGIHEAPSFGLPVVNVGTRQQFRERGKNVIDVSYGRKEIERAVSKALFDKRFRAAAKRAKNPYDIGKAAPRIVKILETVPLPPIQKVISY